MLRARDRLRRLRLAPLMAVLGGPALACAFHGYTPAPTLTDHLLGSEHAVLARPAPGDPARLVAIETLIGPELSADVPALLDPETVARLTSAPGDMVLIARDGAYGPWEQRAYADAALRPVLDAILARLPVWEFGDDLDRYQFFAELMGHADAAVRSLAFSELDRADYAVLRALDLRVDAGTIIAWLQDDAALVPIKALLLGLTHDPAARPTLTAGLRQTLADEAPWLGAYATALLELDGAMALRPWFEDPAVSDLSRERLVEAFAVQAAAVPPSERAAYLNEVSHLLIAAPGLAGAVARQFGLRADGALTPDVRAAIGVAPLTNSADAIAVAQYLALAAPPAAPGLID